ncbi:hypothetical protein [Clostridium tertium]|uniref:Uncharacterized protein n=1 Tax=Clostridium tertium TaxID=1559 RepID=A0A6N3GED2_9CLOT
MRRYIKNKDFIPREYINEKKNKERYRNSAYILLLLIINFIALPKSIETLRDNLNKNQSVEVISTNIEVKDQKKDDILKFIDYLNDDIISLSFSNGSASIEVKNKEIIYYLEEDSNFKINSIKKISEESYIVEGSI